VIGLNQLQSIAYDEVNDNLYIADTGNSRILVVNDASITTSPTANLFAGATLGTFVGEVQLPRGIAVDGSGNIYVADTGNNRIMVNGNGLATGWGMLGRGVFTLVRREMRILLKITFFLLALITTLNRAEKLVWAQSEQPIPLADASFQPVNKMVRSIPAPEFEFEPAENCLCAISARYQPAQGSAMMWVTKRSWFSKPEHKKKFDRMLAILDAQGGVNYLGLDACNSFFCWAGPPWTEGIFKEYPAPIFVGADRTRAFLLRPRGMDEGFCEPAYLVILARKGDYFIMVQEEFDNSFSKDCWQTGKRVTDISQYFKQAGLRKKVILKLQGLAKTFAFRVQE
jgi:hypothetical protein